MVNGVWSVNRDSLTVMQLLQYVLNWGTMTMLPTALYLSKYNDFIIIINIIATIVLVQHG